MTTPQPSGLEHELREFAAVLKQINASDLTAADREQLQELLVAAADLVWPTWPRPERPQDKWAL